MGPLILTPFTLVFSASSLCCEPIRKANGEELNVSEMGRDSPSWGYYWVDAEVEVRTTVATTIIPQLDHCADS